MLWIFACLHWKGPHMTWQKSQQSSPCRSRDRLLRESRKSPHRSHRKGRFLALSVAVASVAALLFAGSAVSACASSAFGSAAPNRAAPQPTATRLSEGGFSLAGVSETLQYPDLPAGCEATALACALTALDCAIGPTDVMATHLRVDAHWSDAAAFLGSPTAGGGAFPPAIVAATRSVAASRGEPIVAADVSGAAFDDLVDLVRSGSPVLVWTTMGFTDPAFSNVYVDGYRWYHNEHCVVLYGWSHGNVLVSDPLEGLVKRDADRFAQLYEACGSYAVCVSRS